MQIVDLEETLHQPDKQFVMVPTEIGADACPVRALDWILHTSHQVTALHFRHQMPNMRL